MTIITALVLYAIGVLIAWFIWGNSSNDNA
jgi:hypothetical protein